MKTKTVFIGIASFILLVSCKQNLKHYPPWTKAQQTYVNSLIDKAWDKAMRSGFVPRGTSKPAVRFAKTEISEDASCRKANAAYNEEKNLLRICNSFLWWQPSCNRGLERVPEINNEFLIDHELGHAILDARDESIEIDNRTPQTKLETTIQNECKATVFAANMMGKGRLLGTLKKRLGGRVYCDDKLLTSAVYKPAYTRAIEILQGTRASCGG